MGEKAEWSPLGARATAAAQGRRAVAILAAHSDAHGQGLGNSTSRLLKQEEGASCKAPSVAYGARN